MKLFNTQIKQTPLLFGVFSVLRVNNIKSKNPTPRGFAWRSGYVRIILHTSATLQSIDSQFMPPDDPLCTTVTTTQPIRSFFVSFSRKANNDPVTKTLSNHIITQLACLFPMLNYGHRTRSLSRRAACDNPVLVCSVYAGASTGDLGPRGSSVSSNSSIGRTPKAAAIFSTTMRSIRVLAFRASPRTVLRRTPAFSASSPSLIPFSRMTAASLDFTCMAPPVCLTSIIVLRKCFLVNILTNQYTPAIISTSQEINISTTGTTAMQKPLTPTQLKVLEWQSTRPAFVGTVRAEHLPGKAERQTAKRQAIKKASAR